MKKKPAKSKAPKVSKLSTASQFDMSRLNTVTSVSKVLAAVLFVALPFMAFILGLMYQESFQVIQ